MSPTEHKEYCDASTFFFGAASAFGEIVSDLEVLRHIAVTQGADHSVLDRFLASAQRRKEENLAEGERRAKLAEYTK